jgi:hypothetical protein
LPRFVGHCEAIAANRERTPHKRLVIGLSRTDILFKTRQELCELYPKLLSHSTLCLGAKEVMNFLGRKAPRGVVATRRDHIA